MANAKVSNALMLAIASAMSAANSIREEHAELLEAIKAEGSKQVDAKNAADDAAMGKGTLWGNILTLAEACSVVKPEDREMVFTMVARELLEVEGTNTAKMYASRGKNVLVKLHTDAGKTWAELKEATYAEIGAMLKPDANPEFTARLKELTKRLKFVGRKGSKGDTLALLDTLEAAVGVAYNPLKAAADSKSAASKAAKELEANRQAAPTEGAQTETVRQAVSF